MRFLILIESVTNFRLRLSIGHPLFLFLNIDGSTIIVCLFFLCLTFSFSLMICSIASGCKKPATVIGMLYLCK